MSTVSKSLRIGGMTSAAVLLLICGYLAILFYPAVLFPHRLEYERFTVYSQRELETGMESILADVEAALATSEIYDPSLHHDIFFGYQNRPFRAIQDIRWRVLAATAGLAPALTYNASIPPHISQVITFRIPDVPNNALLHPERLTPINMTHVLTHEIVHTLLASRLGLARIPRLPLWKQEGYGDYVAASTNILVDPTYSLRRSVERIRSQDLSWMQDDHGNFAPMRYGCQRLATIDNEAGYPGFTCYYIGRVLLEYLFDVKGLSFEEVMRLEVTDTATLDELMSAY